MFTLDLSETESNVINLQPTSSEWQVRRRRRVEVVVYKLQITIRNATKRDGNIIIIIIITFIC